MTDFGTQDAYWNGVGATKTFTHPVNHSWLGGVDRHARILDYDYDCGYGRVTAEPQDHGFAEVSGTDPSAVLTCVPDDAGPARARRRTRPRPGPRRAALRQ